MIRLTRNTAANKNAAPFHDHEQENVGTFFLLVFEPKQGGDSISVVPTIDSDNGRVVIFTIDSTADDPENGQALFPYVGHYTFKAYQQTIQANTDPEAAEVEGLVYEGRAYVADDDSSDVIIYNPDADSITVYNGGN